MRRITAKVGPTVYDLTLKSLAIAQGASANVVPFEEIPESLVVSSAADAENFLTTKPILVPSNGTLTAELRLGGFKRNPSNATGSANVIAQLQLVDASSNATLSSIAIDTLLAGKMDPRTRLRALNLSTLAGRSVRVRIVPMVNADSAVEWTVSVIHYDTSGTGSELVKGESGQTIPDVPIVFSMKPSYPNPFNPTTTIGYELPTDGFVKLVIYDLLGREIAELASGHHVAGRYSATWNASSVASGVYFARLTVMDELGQTKFNKTAKLVLAK